MSAGIIPDGTTPDDLTNIIASFSRKTLRKMGYGTKFLDRYMPDLLSELWVEACYIMSKPQFDPSKRWRSYVLSHIARYLIGWANNNPPWSTREPVWSRTKTPGKRLRSHAMHETSMLEVGGDGDPSISGYGFRLSELMVEVRKLPPRDRAIILLTGMGYTSLEVKDILGMKESGQTVRNIIKRFRSSYNE